MMLQRDYWNALAKVSPNAVYAYLHSQGWERTESYGEKADFFVLGADGPAFLFRLRPSCQITSHVSGKSSPRCPKPKSGTASIYCAICL